MRDLRRGAQRTRVPRTSSSFAEAPRPTGGDSARSHGQAAGDQTVLGAGAASFGPCDAHVAALEAAHDARTDAWRAATRLADHVEHFASLVEDRDQARRGRRAAEEKLKDVREGIGRQRDRQGKVFSGLNQKFEPIIKALLGPDTTGSVTLSGKGFEIRIDAGGDRRTAAIDSLKVVAFDLACLCLSIEEATNAPAFLIHDSPREADLGASILCEVFKLVRDLESMTPMPMFQYIITTTTPPPEGMRVEPWLRLRLSGSPGSERLMRRDL